MHDPGKIISQREWIKLWLRALICLNQYLRQETAQQGRERFSSMLYFMRATLTIMWVKLGNIIPAEASGQKQDLHLGEAPADSQALKHNPRPAGNWAFKSYFVKLSQSNFTKQQHFSSTLLSAFLRSCSRAMHLAFPGSCLVRSQSSSGWGPAPTAGSWHIFTLVRKPPVSSWVVGAYSGRSTANT